MKFKADEIASVIEEEIEQYRTQIDVARGRPGARGRRRHRPRLRPLGRRWPARWSSSPNGVQGLAFNLEESSVGVIILGDYLEIKEGDEVRRTGELLSRAGRRRR